VAQRRRIVRCCWFRSSCGVSILASIPRTHINHSKRQEKQASNVGSPDKSGRPARIGMRL
jgi:hypothetical protein